MTETDLWNQPLGAVLSQNPDVSALVDAEECRAEIERGAA